MTLRSPLYALITIGLLGLIVSSGASPCQCGIPPKNNLLYDSVPSEGDGANPRVAEVSEKNNPEIIWITYNYPGRRNGNQITRALRSEDGGLSWQADPQFRKTESSSSDRSAVAYERGKIGILGMSVDGGVHWIKCQLNVDGLSHERFASMVAHTDHASLDVNLVAIQPHNPSTIYGVLTAKIPSPYAKYIDLPGVYFSQDAGDHWFMFAPDIDGKNRVERTKLAIDPYNSNRMIAHGKSGLVITTDGGKVWSPVGQQADLEAPAELKGRREELARRTDSDSISLFPDFTYLALQQVEFQRGDQNVIYIVTNKGLYKTEDSARSWSLIYAGSPSYYELDSLWLDPNNPHRLFLGTRDKVLMSEDGGCHFKTFFDWPSFVRNRGE